MDFATVNGVVQVHQHSYIDNLQPLHLQAARATQRESLLNETERTAKIKNRTDTVGR